MSFYDNLKNNTKTPQQVAEEKRAAEKRRYNEEIADWVEYIKWFCNRYAEEGKHFYTCGFPKRGWDSDGALSFKSSADAEQFLADIKVALIKEGFPSGSISTRVEPHKERIFEKPIYYVIVTVNW